MKNTYLDKIIINVLNAALAILLFATFVGCTKLPAIDVKPLISANFINYPAHLHIHHPGTIGVVQAKASNSGFDTRYVYKISCENKFTFNKVLTYM